MAVASLAYLHTRTPWTPATRRSPIALRGRGPMSDRLVAHPNPPRLAPPRPSPVPPQLRALDARDCNPLPRFNNNLPFPFPQVQYSSWRGSNPASSLSSLQFDLPDQFLSWTNCILSFVFFSFVGRGVFLVACRIHCHHHIFPHIPQSISAVKRTNQFFVHPDPKLLTDSQTHFSLRSIFQFSVHLLV